MAKYRVLGNREVLGHAHGEEFDADISDTQEERLVAGGHIERVAAPLDGIDLPDEIRDVFTSAAGGLSVSSQVFPPGTNTCEALSAAAADELPDDRAGETDKKE